MYEFREKTEEDTNFILSSWGRSYFEGTRFRRLVFPGEFHRVHGPLRERLLDNKNVKFKVCVGKEDGTIIGWIAFERQEGYALLHYVYVKKAFTGFRIASDLLSQMGNPETVLYTHLTEKAEKIIKKKGLSLLPSPHFKILSTALSKAALGTEDLLPMILVFNPA